MSGNGYQTRTTKACSRSSQGRWQKQSLWSSLYYMFWVTVSVVETKCPALSSFSILFHLFKVEKNLNPCVLNYYINFEMQKILHRIITHWDILCLLGHVLNWYKWLSQTVTQLSWGLPSAWQQGSRLSSWLHCLLLFIAEQGQAEAPHHYFVYFSLRHTLFFSLGEVNPLV